MTIPCSSVVPGNQEKVAPVYGLTECYRVTVCVDQPVASDAITPPPELQQPPDGGGQVPPTAPPQSAGAAAAAAAGAGAAGELPEMGAGEEAAMGPRVPPPAYPVLAEDKEGQDSGYVGASSLVWCFVMCVSLGRLGLTQSIHIISTQSLPMWSPSLSTRCRASVRN